MAVDTSSHPKYAMARRHSPGILYAFAFFVCLAVMYFAFTYFLNHGWFLIHVPTINFKLPDLHLTSPS